LVVGPSRKAGEGTRTLNIQLGRLNAYRATDEIPSTYESPPDGARNARPQSFAATPGNRSDLVDALAMIERLPLTDAERAELVRRLLGMEGGE